MRGMSRLGGFALGCGCKDAKAVAVAASSSASPYTETEASSTATWRRVRAATASGSTGTLTVPSASSSSFAFPWEEVDDGDGEEEVNDSSNFSGLLRQLNELEQSVVSWGRKSTGKSYFSPPPPPPPPLPSRPVVMKGDRHDSNSKGGHGHGNFSPPPPPPPPPPPSFQFQTQQQRKAKSMDKGDDRQEGAVLSRQPPPSSLPFPPGKPPTTKEDVDSRSPLPQPPKHGKLGGTVAVVKQSDDPLSDFRRSMASMVVENGIATGDELRELLRHFLALNAPHHHDAILRAFTEIWDEAFSAKQGPPHRESAARAPTPTPQRRRHPPQVWR